MRRFRIAQFGTYDLPSLGDTMFARVMLNEMQKRFPYAQVDMDLYSPYSLEKPYNDLPPVRSICELKKMHEENPYDALIIGGGEFINYSHVGYRRLDGEQREYDPGDLFEKPTLIAAELGIPVYWNEVGVAYDFEGEMAKRVSKCADYTKSICVRDYYSAQRLLEAGVTKPVYQEPDMLWLLRQNYPQEQLNDLRQQLALRYEFLQSDYFVLQYGTSYRYEEVAQAALEISNCYGWTPLLMVVNYCHEDQQIVNKIRLLNTAFKSIDEVLQPVEIMAVLQGAKLFLGTSLHGNITSMLYQVPALVLDMYPYTVSKMEGLLLDVNRTQWSCTMPRAIRQMVDRLLREEDADQVKQRVNELVARVNAHFDWLAQSIQGRNEIHSNECGKESLNSKSFIETELYSQTSIAHRRKEGEICFLFKDIPQNLWGQQFIWRMVTLNPIEVEQIRVICDGKEIPIRICEQVIEGSERLYAQKEFGICFSSLTEANLSVFCRIKRVSAEKFTEHLNQAYLNKCGHIELLLESERNQTAHIEQLLQTERNQTARIEQLLQTERNQKGHIEQLLQSERNLHGQLDRIQNSHAWKLVGMLWKFRDIVLPLHSRRRVVLKYGVKFLRHPVRFVRKINKQRVQKVIRALRSGEIQVLTEGVNKVMPEIETICTPPEIMDVSYLADSMNAQDYEGFALPKFEHPLVSIIIPVYNQFHYTYACLNSIVKHSGDVPYEVIIANDCSTDLTARIEEIVSGVKLITNEKNLRFLLNCNNAAKFARGKYILFLNNDTQVQANWLRPLVDLIESDEQIGMVGSKLIYPDGKLQEAGGILWQDGSAWNYGNGQNPERSEYNYVKEVDYISGAAIMIRKDLWQQLGGFDQRFAPAYCEDSDLAFMVRQAGHKVMYQPLSIVVHFEGVSNGTDTSSGQKAYQVANQKKFYEKWKEVLEREHNPNSVNVFLARDRSIGKKTVLIVDHYVPTYDKDAGSRTVFQYLKLFVAQGYNVKFIGDNFYRSEPYTTKLQQMGIEVLYGPEYAQGRKNWIVQNAESIHYVFLNRPHIACNYIDWIKNKTKARIVYYGHDLHFLRMTREAEVSGDKGLLAEAQKWKKRELELMCKADMAYYPSEVEVETIHEVDPSIRVKAIPAYLFENVEDVFYEADKRRDIMFIGGYTHTPNIDAAVFMVESIMPKLLELIPDIRLHLIGSNAPERVQKLANEHIVFDGMISDAELAEFYRRCRVSVVPLRYGAGIKGKVIEAMKEGLPVMTTSVGAEGIDGAENILCIEDDPQLFAEKLAALYKDTGELVRRSKASIEYVREHYSPANAVKAIGPEFDM